MTGSAAGAHGCRIHVHNVNIAESEDARGRWSIDEPGSGVTVPGPTVRVSGRAFSDPHEEIVGVEIAVDGHVVGRSKLDSGARGDRRFHVSLPVAGPGLVHGYVDLVCRDHRRRTIAQVLVERFHVAPDGARRVSVVIPCYNQAHFLSEAIDSILEQTYPDVEIIVVDDGSADNTSEIVARYPCARCIRQPNSGLSAARNTGLRSATGEFVVFLDADDLLLADALTEGVRALDARPDAAFVFGSTMFTMNDGTEPPPSHHPKLDSDHYAVILAGCPIMPPAAVMFRRSIFDKVEPFDTSLHPAADCELYYRIARGHPVVSHGRLVSIYRRHGSSMTSGSVRGLLRANLTAIHRERHFVWRRPRYWHSYRTGTRYWRLHYGSRLAAEVQQDLLKLRLISAAKGVATLTRWWPRGLLIVATSPRRVAALPEWKPDQ